MISSFGAVLTNSMQAHTYLGWREGTRKRYFENVIRGKDSSLLNAIKELSVLLQHLE